MNARSEILRNGKTCHPDCFACRPRHRGGLGLQFSLVDESSVAAEFDCDSRFQSYPDRLHGGVVSLLLDAAMTHCLFAHGVRGYTARLQIRFHKPVELARPARIVASVIGVRAPLFRMRAEIWQSGLRRASAEASFHGEALDPTEAAPGERADGAEDCLIQGDG